MSDFVEVAAEDSAHPTHETREVPSRLAPGVAFAEIVYPAPGRGWAGRRARRACIRDGGHWWHPTGRLWRCCQCGASSR